MKLFWKIFFTAMFVSSVCVTLSGYLLINSSFRSQLDSEFKIAGDYGDIVYYSLANEFEAAGLAGIYLNLDEITAIVTSISINSMNQRVAFAVIDENHQYIFSSLDVSLEKSMISSLDTDKAGWTLQEQESEIYIQTIRPGNYFGNTFYIETVRNVTHLFRNQKEQYELMIKIIAGMLIFAGGLTFIISKFLVRRIVALTEITRTISGGSLSERADTKGQDEIALLSQNFNQMADTLEEKIHELEDEAERKELFVGSFAHELKTPLTSIIGYSDLLRRKEMDGEQRHICAEYIFTEGKRLETLSMRLLDLIVMKKHELNPKPNQIADVLGGVKAVLMPQLKEADIKLNIEAERAIIPMEAELMKTVFINLIDNARKAIEGSGEITLKGESRQGLYTLTVRDTGKGMEKQELDRITEAFYMVDKSRARRQGGAGLGLAICREILLLHDFSIAFDSTVNKGTVVTVTMKEQAE